MTSPDPKDMDSADPYDQGECDGFHISELVLEGIGRAAQDEAYRKGFARALKNAPLQKIIEALAQWGAARGH